MVQSLGNSSSNILNRMMLALRAGLSFGGARDYYQVFGYPKVIQPIDLMARYERQDIAKRVVDSPPDATWAYPPELTESPAAVKVWKELADAQQLWAALLQADKLCAFDQYAVLWLGMSGNTESPAPKITKTNDIKYITAHGAGTVAIDTYEQDTSSERFGMPTTYRISIERVGTIASSKKVHWTRVVHITDLPVQGKLFAPPRLSHVFNILSDILKIAGGSAETYWLAANRGMQVDVDKEMTLTDTDALALSDEIDEYQHQLRRVLRTRGVKVTNLGSDLADPTGTFGTLLSLLAAATSIPQRILIGAEAGQLASAQDRANWAEFIARRRVTYAQAYVMLPVLRRLEGLGLLPAGEALKVQYVWPHAFHQNPLEESQTMSAKARALINLSRQSQYGTPYVGLKEGRVWLGLPPDLPADDAYPVPAATPASGSKLVGKQGGNAASGGAGGNDGSGNSGGGASNDPLAPSGDAASNGTAVN